MASPVPLAPLVLRFLGAGWAGVPKEASLGWVLPGCGGDGQCNWAAELVTEVRGGPRTWGCVGALGS